MLYPSVLLLLTVLEYTEIIIFLTFPRSYRLFFIYSFLFFGLEKIFR
jgi:hypothetical protein